MAANQSLEEVLNIDPRWRRGEAANVVEVRDYSWVSRVEVISESRAFRLARITRGGQVQYAVLVWDESEQDYVSGGEMSAADMQSCLLGAATALTHLK